MAGDRASFGFVQPFFMFDASLRRDLVFVDMLLPSHDSQRLPHTVVLITSTLFTGVDTLVQKNMICSCVGWYSCRLRASWQGPGLQDSLWRLRFLIDQATLRSLIIFLSYPVVLSVKGFEQQL